VTGSSFAQVWQLVAQALNIADQCIKALTLKNVVIPSLQRDPTNAGVIDRYRVACTMVERRIQELYPLVPQIKDVFVDPAISRVLTLDQKRALDKQRLTFLEKLKKIDDASKMIGPNPHTLIPVPPVHLPLQLPVQQPMIAIHPRLIQPKTQ
jgi:hypothetical protein